MNPLKDVQLYEVPVAMEKPTMTHRHNRAVRKSIYRSPLRYEDIMGILNGIFLMWMAVVYGSDARDPSGTRTQADAVTDV